LGFRVGSSGAVTACGSDGCALLDAITLLPEGTYDPVGILNPLTTYAPHMQQGLPTTCGYVYNSEPCGLQGNKNAYWDAVCLLLAENPLDPFSLEGIYVEVQFGRLGIHAKGCTTLDYEKLSPTLSASTAGGGYNVTQSILFNYGLPFGNSWVELYFDGNWFLDFVGRAVTATRLLLMKTNDKAVYYTSFVDSHRQPLSGANTYKITFNGSSAEVDTANGGFWSLTVYDDTFYMYELATHNSIHNTTTTPEAVHFARVCQSGVTCIPVPAGAFNIIYRRYVPNHGWYKPPHVEMCAPTAPCN